MARVRDLARERGLGDLTRIGGGLEFVAYRAIAPTGSAVVLRFARSRFGSNVNDPDVDTRTLLVQEHEITAHLASHGFPVARPVALSLGDVDVLISDYMPDDGAGFNSTELGRLLARLHEVPAPRLRPVASEGLPCAELIPARLERRWREVARLVGDWPELPSAECLRRVLADRPGGRLLHLDVRSANLRCSGRRVSAFLDWSNALIGDPLLELGRLSEFAWLPENGLDLDGVSAGYRAAGASWPEPDGPLWLYQLDAAVMLALVFLSESPNPARARQVVGRVRELRERLLGS